MVAFRGAVFFLLLLAGPAPLAPVLGCSESVVAGDEDVDDGQEILGELLFAAWWIIWLCLIEHHKFCVRFAEEPLDHLNAKPAEAVPVDDGNLADMPGEDALQKGLKSPAFEVEAGSNVLDDLVAWALLAEVVDLALEVVLLLRGGDTGVADVNFLFLVVLVVGDTEEAADVLDAVEALGASGHSDGGESLFLFPAHKGLARDVILSVDGGGRDILGHDKGGWDR